MWNIEKLDEGIAGPGKQHTGCKQQRQNQRPQAELGV
jgi:hypothetical protein